MALLALQQLFVGCLLWIKQLSRAPTAYTTVKIIFGGGASMKPGIMGRSMGQYETWNNCAHFGECSQEKKCIYIHLHICCQQPKGGNFHSHMQILQNNNY